jgi:hypothetical protein
MPSRSVAEKRSSGGAPKFGEPAVRVIGARVIGVQCKAVAQLQIGFRHAQPPVAGADSEDSHPSSRHQDGRHTRRDVVADPLGPWERGRGCISCPVTPNSGCTRTASVLA